MQAVQSATLSKHELVHFPSLVTANPVLQVLQVVALVQIVHSGMDEKQAIVDELVQLFFVEPRVNPELHFWHIEALLHCPQFGILLWHASVKQKLSVESLENPALQVRQLELLEQRRQFGLEDWQAVLAEQILLDPSI